VGSKELLHCFIIILFEGELDSSSRRVKKTGNWEKEERGVLVEGKERDQQAHSSEPSLRRRSRHDRRHIKKPTCWLAGAGTVSVGRRGLGGGVR